MINLNGKNWYDLAYSDVVTLLESEINESFFLEFKEDRVKPEKIAKAVSAFANSYGGYIVIGINDDKTIDKGCIEWNEQRVHATITNSVSPIPQFDVKTLTDSDIKLIIIRISEGSEPPYITNRGEIYQRISSGSTLITKSERIDSLIQKRISRYNEIDKKISIPDLIDPPNNCCGYIDYGFSLTTHNDFEFFKNFNSLDLNPAIELLRKCKSKYSFAKLSDSFAITIGEQVGSNELYIPIAGCCYVLEIMRDGSVRARIPLLGSKDKKDEVDYFTPTIIHILFGDIYSKLIGADFDKLFIEANKFERLVVIKQFKPYFDIDLFPTMEFNDDYVKRDFEHIQKYGTNIIPIGHRIPISGFSKIDRIGFDDHGIEYNKETLIINLFNVKFLNFGFVDEVNLHKITK